MGFKTKEFVKMGEKAGRVGCAERSRFRDASCFQFYLYVQGDDGAKDEKRGDSGGHGSKMFDVAERRIAGRISRKNRDNRRTAWDRSIEPERRTKPISRRKVRSLMDLRLDGFRRALGRTGRKSLRPPKRVSPRAGFLLNSPRTEGWGREEAFWQTKAIRACISRPSARSWPGFERA